MKYTLLEYVDMHKKTTRLRNCVKSMDIKIRNMDMEQAVDLPKNLFWNVQNMNEDTLLELKDLFNRYRKETGKKASDLKNDEDAVYRHSYLYENKEDVSVAINEIIANHQLIRSGFIGEVEGGLTFEYLKEGELHRLVIGFTELGSWIYFNGKV